MPDPVEENLLARLDTALLPLPRDLPEPEGGKKPLRRSAVLVPIVLRPEGLTLLLTRRADHLKSHPGQVGFPGGRIEPADATPADAALREAMEEIGLSSRFVTLKGALPPRETGTGFYIFPIVGLVAPGFTLVPDASEVAEIFEVPLMFLMDPRNHEPHHYQRDGAQQVYHSIPYDGRTIWGATAGMIVSLYEVLFGKENSAPAKSIARAPWLNAPATRRVIEALEAQGAPARFVGGCVRNALIGMPVKDIDIATPEKPETVIRLLEQAGLKAIPTGLAHGTITAVAEGAGFEITSLRRDVTTDGRHATVAFTRDWAEDAQRRDFTMNALYADAGGALHDYVGGLDDLRARRVRFIGDPAARIAEDYLRILRFFRLHAWYGKGVLDAQGLAACAAGKAGLERLSAERVAQELTRLLEAANPAPVLPAMAETGVLSAVLPEAAHLDHLTRLFGIEAAIGRPADWALRLSVLTGSDPGQALRLAARLKLSAEARDRLHRLAADRTPIEAGLSIADLQAGCYRLGPALFRDLALKRWAEGPDIAFSAEWLALTRETFRFTPPVFPLKGADVIAAGLPEGPAVGRHLAALEEAWIEDGFKDGRAALLERLKARITGSAREG